MPGSLLALLFFAPPSGAQASITTAATPQILQPIQTLADKDVPTLLCVEMFLDRSHVGGTPSRDLVQRLGGISEGEWALVLETRRRFKEQREARRTWAAQNYSEAAAGHPDPRSEAHREAIDRVDIALLRRRVRGVAEVYSELLRNLPGGLADALHEYVRPPSCAGASASLNTADPNGFDSDYLAIWFSFDDLLEELR